MEKKTPLFKRAESARRLQQYGGSDVTTFLSGRSCTCGRTGPSEKNNGVKWPGEPASRVATWLKPGGLSQSVTRRAGMKSPHMPGWRDKHGEAFKKQYPRQ